MASIASFRPAEGHRSPPISLHPAFPAVVALWFAALLGLGSLVLPGVLLDRLVEASGLASVIPAMAPPLGFTARALVALMAGLGGAALGIAIARRVAAPHAAATNSTASRAAAGSRRPIRVHEELGGDGLTNGEAPPLNRRRATLIADLGALTRDRNEGASLPAGEADRAAAPVHPCAAPAVEDEPLVLSEIAEDEPSWAEAEPAGSAGAAADASHPMPGEPTFPTFSAVETASGDPSPDDAPPGEPESNSPATGDAAPLPFAAPPPAEEPAAELDDTLEAPFEPPLDRVAPTLRPVADAPAPDEFLADWEQKPLEDLGLVQLVQRLGSALERRRASTAVRADEPAPSTAPAPIPVTGVEAARAEEAARAMAAYFGAAPAEDASDETLSAPRGPAPDAARDGPAEPLPRDPAPAAPPGLRPEFLSGLAMAAAEEDEEAGEPLPDFSLPLRQFARPEDPQAGFGASEARADEARENAGISEGEEADDDGFPSLLALRSSASGAKKFVRIEEDRSTRGERGSETGVNRLFDPPADREEPVSFAPSAPEGEPQAAAAPGPESEARAEGEAGRESEAGTGTGTAASPGLAPGADADAALRAALATLQRMSGASESRFG